MYAQYIWNNNQYLQMYLFYAHSENIYTLELLDTGKHIYLQSTNVVNNA